MSRDTASVGNARLVNNTKEGGYIKQMKVQNPLNKIIQQAEKSSRRTVQIAEGPAQLK